MTRVAFSFNCQDVDRQMLITLPLMSVWRTILVLPELSLLLFLEWKLDSVNCDQCLGHRFIFKIYLESGVDQINLFYQEWTVRKGHGYPGSVNRPICLFTSSSPSSLIYPRYNFQDLKFLCSQEASQQPFCSLQNAINTEGAVGFLVPKNIF